MLTLVTLLTTYALSMSLFTASTPLALGLIILFLALGTASSIAMTSSTWFGFVTFLIYVGGMLVMFAYFTALSPNTGPLFLPAAMTTTATFIAFSTLPITCPPLHLAPLLTNTAHPSLSLFTPNNIPILILLGMALLLALIAVVKISTTISSPLRPFKLN